MTRNDIRIVQRAREVLNSPAKWNRADNRKCAPNATTYSLYCALEKATQDISKTFEHRGAAMLQARFVIDEELAKGNHNDHRLMDYNNDPKTTFADVQRFFALLEKRIQKQLDAQQSHGYAGAGICSLLVGLLTKATPKLNMASYDMSANDLTGCDHSAYLDDRVDNTMPTISLCARWSRLRPIRLPEESP